MSPLLSRRSPADTGCQAPAAEQSNPAPLRWRVLGREALLTNECGGHAWLPAKRLRELAAGRIGKTDSLWRELQAAGFIRDHMDFAALSESWRRLNLVGWPGPNLHVMALTSRCNGGCLYCSAGSAEPQAADRDMTEDTARKTLEFIFRAPGPELTIEFQGGEPLLNWPVLQFATLYAKQLAQATGKRLHLSLISNLQAMDEAKLAFLAKEGVSICTSLDGPAAIHDRNRGKGSHARTVSWLKRIQRLRTDAPIDPPNAVCTVTRAALGDPKGVVDEFLRLKLERVQLGPLDPLGRARRAWDELGYGPAEYLAFYEKALDYLLQLTARGVRVYEKGALIFLIRVLRREHWRFPNADVLARLAYDRRGDIYPCDEGRLLADNGD
ncbi:MAG: radical SAM protein, partial [Elusimicrobia bacterium]|nr:radical SAM protein [Elusimicrobiota bacterium]